jgi:hypothetical protein
MTPSQFRQDFPEFADTSRYPDSQVQMWLTAAVSLVNERRWMELTTLGLELVTAHYLTLGVRDVATGNAGGTPGEVKGPTTSKAVDKVSVGYDSAAATIEDGGSWNLTSYGIRYITLARMMGAGGLQF